MSDAKRYDILKDRTIDVPFFDTDKLAQIDSDDYDALERIGKSGAFKMLRRIGEDFGVFREGYTTQDLDVEFKFSRRNLYESVYKQQGDYQNYVKMLMLFENVIDKAIGIEAHKERYDNPGSRIDTVFVLMSAYVSNTGLIPVMLSVKTYTDDTTSSLYIAVSLRKIKRSRIVGHIPDTNNVKSYPLPASIKMSLADVFLNVNVYDKNLLKYIPDGFLDDSQRKAKQEALKETSEYIEKKNKQRASRTDEAMADDWIVSEKYVEYQSDEDCIILRFRVGFGRV